MTRQEYKEEILELRKRFRATGRDYLRQFLKYWFPRLNTKGETHKRYRRDLQSFLRGSGFIHAYAEPYAFLPKIYKYLQSHETRQRHAENRSAQKEGQSSEQEVH